MVDPSMRKLLCELVDELRLRGVHAFRMKDDTIDMEILMNPSNVETTISQAVKTRLLNDPKTPPEVLKQLREEEDNDDLNGDDLTGAG